MDVTEPSNPISKDSLEVEVGLTLIEVDPLLNVGNIKKLNIIGVLGSVHQQVLSVVGNLSDEHPVWLLLILMNQSVITLVRSNKMVVHLLEL